MDLLTFIELCEVVRDRAACGGWSIPNSKEEYMAWFYDELQIQVDQWKHDFNVPGCATMIKNLTDAIARYAREGVKPAALPWEEEK
jgi:hypothetical protein